MSLNLSSPPPAYTLSDQASLRAQLQQADALNLKRGQDVTGRLIVKSPNGAAWVLTVSNTGTVSATAL